ncbi:MAG TPA: protein adenylyltransferase SelO family protein, partial [Microthrixaceae bacterium]|nr:protein adenylyltransferase SelO family protein [Microthrixaceae bacterium]
MTADGQSQVAETQVLELQHRFLSGLPELSLEWQGASVPDPSLVVLNESLAVDLGLDVEWLRSADGVDVISGNRAPVGSVPVALGYAGHQFGNYSPRLGDGRALLLGELVTPEGTLIDIHLKGSGRTPFARGGDGKATIGPMLREYVVAESLNSLGVPTTRSLAVVLTGERINRNRVEPGAVLTRVAASHIRVGTFEYAVRLGGSDLVRRLADHAIERHYPYLAAVENPYVELLRAVVDSQAKLIANWMLLGFIHGVMNTDNMTISGEGIDYGPCAFMERYDPTTVFSSIDHAGRYAYGNQAPIAAWNLARLAETMLDLLADDTAKAVEVATEIVNGFPGRFNDHWRS